MQSSDYFYISHRVQNVKPIHSTEKWNLKTQKYGMHNEVCVYAEIPLICLEQHKIMDYVMIKNCRTKS